MIAIVRIALQRPYTFIVMALLILIYGTLAALKTPTDIFPNIGVPVVSTVFSYNGLQPDAMAGRIVAAYERTLTTTVNDIEHIESQSVPGFGVIKIFFQPNVDIRMAMSQVTSVSQTVLKQMPPGLTPPLILNYNASTVPILQLALSSSTVSQGRLNDIALNIVRPQLITVPGASIPYPYGGRQRQLEIDLNQSALRSYGLSANDVVNALAAQNLITPVGTQKIGSFEYTVVLNDAPQQIDTFNSLPIKTVNGSVIYLRDVAYAHIGGPPQTNVVHVNGANAVLLTIQKNGSASTLDVIAGIKALLPSIQSQLPAGISITPVGDQSAFVKGAVSSVIFEGVLAAALTGFMILLFLGSWRSTLIITISIPLAVLTSLTIMSLLGETINVMTLGGLALAVGILVDDATVTIENINWHLEHGKRIEPAIMDGARQIVVPATVSLMCICIAFVPMFSLNGIPGYLFRPLAEAVVFAMMGSYVLSRTLVPTLANYLLRVQEIEAGHGHGHHEKPPTRNPFALFQRGFERRFEYVRSVYRGLLGLCMKGRGWVIVGFLGVTVLSMGLTPWLGENFFPDVDGGQIKMHIRGPIGTRLEDTVRINDHISDAIKTIIPPNEIDGIVANIGLPVSGINLAYSNSGTIGPEDADILINLKPDHSKPTATYVDALRAQLPRMFPGQTFAFLPADIASQVLNFGAPAPIDVQVVGSDLEANRKYADMLLTRIGQIPGIADPRIQQANRAPTFDVDVNRTLAGFVGLTERDASTSMVESMSGSSQTASSYWLNPRNGISYSVSVQTPQRDLDTMNQLTNLPLSSPNGSQQLLGGLATVHRSTGNALVTHYNIRPVLEIYATTHGRDLGAVAADIQKLLDDTRTQLPHGSYAAIRGQVTTMASAYQQLELGLAFSIVLIYFVIVVNFQSWLDPFVIVMALPTAIAGIVWMLFATHTTLSVPALTGAIMCMGVATANSILVISFARERLAAGLDAISAAMEAGAVRFRPVLMTALAMIIGMAPMALEGGQNAPLGRAVIGGLIFATCATLFLVPTVFSMVHARESQRRQAAHAHGHGGHPAHGHAITHTPAAAAPAVTQLPNRD
ncbi:MAG TPA: efflux RND transporter permease subunit [Stellaceae bacterium]|nr:efflux RND transporter permease subunit [Stellaceae bacterium]